MYVASRDGADIQKVSGSGFAAVPSWSPDQKWLAFVRGETSRPRVWNLWMRDMTTGDAGNSDAGQDLRSIAGKILRLDLDGRPAAGNPFAGAVWSYGHRNIQAAALHPTTGALWTVEHGAQGGDELNQLKAFAEELEKSGAGHVASHLASLHEQIQSDNRDSARTLLTAQTAVRLLERLLTLRVVKAQYAAALATGEAPAEDDDATDEDEL